MEKLEHRDYQQRIIEKTIDYFEDDFTSVIIESPTGSGKSVVGLAIIQYFEDKFGWSSSWIAMRRNLLVQIVEMNKRFFNCKGMVPVSMFDKAPPKVDILVADECLPYETVVWIRDNSVIRQSYIGDVVTKNLGSQILSFGSTVEFKPIKQRFRMGTRELLRITVESGTKVKELFITETGRLWTSRGYIRAKDLQEGMEISCLAEYWQTFSHENKRPRRLSTDRKTPPQTIRGEIISVERTGRFVSTYDIEVADNHNFFANDILVHNCQHAAADSCVSIITKSRPRLILGLSATPFRTDRLILSFQKFVKDAGIHRLIQEGWLSQFYHWSIEKWTPRHVADVYLAEQEKWGKSVAFFHTISQCYEFAVHLACSGVHCEVITGITDREEQLDAFDEGKFPIVANVAILNEGFDCPDLISVFVRDSVRLPTIQMAGRALRPGKDHANIIQSCNAHWQFARTAKPEKAYVRNPIGWVSLGNSDKVEKEAFEMIQRIIQIETEIPEFLLKKDQRKRRITLRHNGSASRQG